MVMKLTLFVLLLVAVTSVLGNTAERPLRRRRPTLSEAVTSSSPNQHGRFTPKMIPGSFQEHHSKSKFHYDVKDFMESCKLEPGCHWNCERAEHSKHADCTCLCKSEESQLKIHRILPPRYTPH